MRSGTVFRHISGLGTAQIGSRLKQPQFTMKRQARRNAVSSAAPAFFGTERNALSLNAVPGALSRALIQRTGLYGRQGQQVLKIWKMQPPSVTV